MAKQKPKTTNKQNVHDAPTDDAPEVAESQNEGTGQPEVVQVNEPAPVVATRAKPTLDDLVAIANDQSIRTGYISRRPELTLEGGEADTLHRLALGLGCTTSRAAGILLTALKAK